MANKKAMGFVLEKDQKAIIDELTNEEAGIIFKAIYDYETTKEEPALDKSLRIVFKQFKIKLDFYDEKYNETCKKNKENIQNYWNKVKDTTEYDRIQSNTIDTNKIKEKKSKEKKRKENVCVGDNSIYSDTVASSTNNTPTLSELRSYCLENEMSDFNVEYFFNYYEANGWFNKNGSPIKNWKAKIKTWYSDDKKNGRLLKNRDESRRLG